MNKQLLQDQQALDEFFSVPIGLEEVDNIYGFRVYSSDRLVEAFLKAIKRSGRGNIVYEPIKKLVEQKRIMPIYQVKGILKFLKHKVFGDIEDKAIAGFYHMQRRRVYIMIDNNISIFGLASNDELASTAIHECQHLFADLNRSKFMTIFKEELERYYISAFSRMFQLNQVPKKAITDLIKLIASFEGERLSNIKQKSLRYIPLTKPFMPYSSFDENLFNKNVNDIITLIEMFTTNFSIFIKQYRNYKNIAGSLDRAYRDAFGKRNMHTTPYQELISVSEVISVLSEIRPGNPKIKKVFQSFS